jgi:two-component sensor histidine kinase
MILSMGAEWAPHLNVDAAPALVPTDKAVSIGLIVTELVINANKYAYDGRPGPIEIALRQDSANLRLSVSDNGRGRATHSGGFGTRMIDSLVRQLEARLDYADNDPGLRAVLTIPNG